MKEILGLRDLENTQQEEEIGTIESIDSHVEQLEEGRINLFKGFLASRIGDKVGNAIPVANLFKQIPEIFVGETSSGRRLEGRRDKFVHAIEMLAVNVAAGILVGEYKGEIGAQVLGFLPILKAASNINNSKEAIILSKETVMGVFGAIKYMATDKEFIELTIASIAALPAGAFSNEIVELDIKNA